MSVPAYAAEPAALNSVIPDTIGQRVLACVACHGKEGRATNLGYFPRIAGKPAGYLYNQLVNFREGRRIYGAMTYLIDHMSDDYLHEIAGYFASLDLPYPPPVPASNVTAADRARGEALLMRGDPQRDIPACVRCHGAALTGTAPTIPGLLGLPREYLVAQFGAWKTGQRTAAQPDCMAQISKRLTAEDVSAVANWLISQPVPANSKPALDVARPLPIACGSDAR